MIPDLSHFQIHGHRGARGLFPENTLTGFIEAIKLGTTILEMDLVISKDLKAVVSHEEWMNPIFCLQPNGKNIEINSKEKYNLFQMNYEEIALFDCGSKKNPEFPLQKNVPEKKPLFSEVINAIELFTKNNQLPPVIYNIEIKSELIHDDIFQPKPSSFINIVLKEIEQLKIDNRYLIQSFDIRILQEIHSLNLNFNLGLLIENQCQVENNINHLGFKPFMYNPDFNLVTQNLIHELHQQNIKIFPWTVNEINDMKKLIEMGVDGLITDYPNLGLELIKSL
ncbi:MAG: glycerophosphodiester phosphodiesterase family protein [Bacteroidota bacterium]|jgi:glycerophosphoryl diester phosphodiesterase